MDHLHRHWRHYRAAFTATVTATTFTENQSLNQMQPLISSRQATSDAPSPSAMAIDEANFEVSNKTRFGQADDELVDSSSDPSASCMGPWSRAPINSGGAAAAPSSLALGLQTLAWLPAVANQLLSSQSEARHASNTHGTQPLDPSTATQRLCAPSTLLLRTPTLTDIIGTRGVAYCALNVPPSELAQFLGMEVQLSVRLALRVLRRWSQTAGGFTTSLGQVRTGCFK